MKTSNIKWTCTDPDTQQYGRQLTDNSFEFKEDGKIEEIIKLSEYSVEDIESCINSYGYTLHPTSNTNIYKVYGKHTSWIIAECIFEQL